ncbi:MAG: hypothetical protein BJ554DRAFT_1153 [Olpidium bornovanus]|uniref:Uncharacterized protein n=1 Tax=Olpidium bornovanus TaxID=278681 RepID=A0A8H7ZSU8_9FUNG|nr:MAG: hypothetical protein BJ554DRAFT_1153 [Olpidium bornovanus]
MRHGTSSAVALCCRICYCSEKFGRPRTQPAVIPFGRLRIPAVLLAQEGVFAQHEKPLLIFDMICHIP